MTDYYQLLNITPDATPDAVRKAFRKAAKQFHPDLYQGNDLAEKEQRQKTFILITQGYETLIDPKRRGT